MSSQCLHMICTKHHKRQHKHYNNKEKYLRIQFNVRLVISMTIYTQDVIAPTDMTVQFV